MNYTVEWIQQAIDDLAAVWLAADDREAVVWANARIDAILGTGPLEAGEGRTSGVNRVLIEQPLGVQYEVIEDDKRVIVQAVWAVG